MTEETAEVSAEENTPVGEAGVKRPISITMRNRFQHHIKQVEGRLQQFHGLEDSWSDTKTSSVWTIWGMIDYAEIPEIEKINDVLVTFKEDEVFRGLESRPKPEE